MYVYIYTYIYTHTHILTVAVLETEIRGRGGGGYFLGALSYDKCPPPISGMCPLPLQQMPALGIYLLQGCHSQFKSLFSNRNFSIDSSEWSSVSTFCFTLLNR